MVDLTQIHLWSPLSIPIDPWIHTLDNFATLYESEHSIKLQPSISQLRSSTLSTIDLGNIIESIYEGNLNIIVIDLKDFNNGLENISRMVRIMLDHINETPLLG